jgi:glycosyltransferase involved in cell wall biosynthesis
LEVSVVICAYTLDRWPRLVQAVRSVLGQTRPPCEVIVVVDHNDALLERVRAELHGVVVVANSQAPGLSGARNTGASAASGPIVAFLDDDAEALPDWIEHLTEGYRTERALGVGGSIEPAWPAGRPSWFPPEFDWVVGCTYEGMPSDPAPVRNLIGANMSLRRDVLEAVGGFRLELGRVEETELCIRARKSFPEDMWLYWPSAGVRHNVLTARTRWTYFWRRCHSEGVAKATMTRLTGRRAGLRSEQDYVLRTLPHGVLRGVRDALRGDISGLARSGAIVVGLGLAAGGFLRGSVAGRLARAPRPVSLDRRGDNP